MIPKIRLFSTFVFLSWSSLLSAQVGINCVDPDINSILDIRSNNKGVLFPKFTLNPTDPYKHGLFYFDGEIKGSGKFKYYDSTRTSWQYVNPWDASNFNAKISAPKTTLVSIGDANVKATLEVNTVYATSNIKTVSINAEGTIYAKEIQGFGTIPIGGIIMWSGTSKLYDTNWVLCKGGKVNVSGSPINGEAIPDLSGRFIVGYDGTSNPNPDYNSYIKSDKDITNVTVTIQSGNLPPHSHGVYGSTSTDGSHTHGYQTHQDAANHSRNDALIQSSDNDTDRTIPESNSQIAPSGTHNHSVSGGTDFRYGNSSGSVDAIDIRPPYYVLAFIMRVK